MMQHKDVVETAEIQHVKVMKTAEEEMQHVKVMKTAEEEMQHVKVMKTAEEEMQHVKAMKTTDDDDEDGRMSERQDRNGIGQARGPSLPAPSVRRSSKMPEDRPRFSSRRDYSLKRSSDERNRCIDGRRRSPLSKKSRYSSWARKIGKSRRRYRR